MRFEAELAQTRFGCDGCFIVGTFDVPRQDDQRFNDLHLQIG